MRQTKMGKHGDGIADQSVLVIDELLGFARGLRAFAGSQLGLRHETGWDEGRKEAGESAARHSQFL